MMKAEGRRGFFSGMILGVVLSLVLGVIAVYLLITLDVVSVSVLEAPRVQLWMEWLRRNLGLSVLPFSLTLGLYIHSLQELSRRLEDKRPQDEVGQFEHLTDIWTSLFFGIGVIWTAIGMRSALLYALGDPDIAAESGAFAVLQRLVDGGLLTALTTTILGGIGGYLMRVSKSFLLGARLNRYYEEQDQRHSARVEHLLYDIRDSIGSLGAESSPAATTYNRAQAK
jgi:hypothetical protein